MQLALQMVHFFAVMLWVAAALAIVAGMSQLAWAIAAVVLLNGVFAFTQEHRAERAAARLREMVPQRATVLRDGARRTIDVGDVVVGDVVMLEPGDRVCADLQVDVAHGLQVDASMLTGESRPERPRAGDPVLAGTLVADGEATATVTATGSATRLASITRLTTEGRRPDTPLAVELRHVVHRIAAIALSVGLGYFAISTLLGRDPAAGFLFTVGITVALVPEGLLPTVTLSLAMGAQRMARRNALVRRLESVETLGSTTFICTDKTGTLTSNDMNVREVWTPHGITRIVGTGYEPRARIDADDARSRSAAADALRMAALCSTGMAVQVDGGWTAQGDPMEAALDAAARRLGVDTDVERSRVTDTARFAFDPRRRRMSVVRGGVVFAKGAPDAMTRVSSQPPGYADQLHDMAGRGLRVLAVATRSLGDQSVALTVDAVEQGLELVALIGLEDPPRPAAPDALAACRRAGIAVAMVTGDHPATALAIAREVGLHVEGAPALEGRDLPADDDELRRLVDRDGLVVSRVEPEDKLRIARALRASGHVVAMTGDGVNDGPALHAADIGVAMGRSGSDVAREAADLVLLDDDFATIVAAIEQGRAIDANIRRFLTYHLTDNVAELTPFVLWALSGGTIPLAIGVLQVLALDLATDTLSAVSLGAEPARPGMLVGRPTRRRLLDRAVAVRAFLVLGPAEAAASMVTFFVVLWMSGWWPGEPLAASDRAHASGAAFLAIVLGQAATAFACRSDHVWVGGMSPWGNPLLVGAKLVELVLTAVLLGVPVFAGALMQAAPTPAGVALACLAPCAVVAVDWASKRRRRASGQG